MDKRRPHRSYLLRLWQAEGSAWRASLESPHTGERHGFASLEALFAFLEAETAAAARRGPQEGSSGDAHRLPGPET